jgi:putative oxidoreductase
MAATAGVSELGGGLLTLSGLAHPLGPVTLAGTMAVASTTHRANGPFAAKRGFELPLTNMSAALVLAAVGPGRFSLDGLFGTQLPRWLAAASVVGVAAGSAAAVAMLLRAEPEPPPAESKSAEDIAPAEGAAE